MVTYDSDEEGAREEALEEAEEEGKYTGGSDVDVVEEEEKVAEVTGVVADPETGEQVKVTNPAVDNDERGDPVDTAELTDGEVQESADRNTDSSEAAQTGKQDTVIKEKLNEQGEAVEKQVINGSNQSSDINQADKNKNKLDNKLTLNKATEESRDAATELDNYFTTNARESFEEVQQASRRGRKANRELNPNSLNPVSLTSKAVAGGESLFSETVEAANTENDFNLQDARQVSEDRVKQLQGTIGEVSGPLTTPVETANLAASSVPRIFTSQFAEDENQKARDVNAASILDAGQATAKQAQKNPTEFALGASLGFATGRSASRALKDTKAADLGSKTGKLAKKADPATGVGRTPRPGEVTKTSPEIVKDQAGKAKDFVKGDLGKEITRKPEARKAVFDAGDTSVRGRQKVDADPFGRPEKLDETADEIVVDTSSKGLSQPGNVPIEVRDVRRRDIVKDKLSNTRKGQADLKLETKDKTPEFDDSDFTGRRIDSEDRRTDVDTGDSVEDRLLRDRSGRRTDKTEFNKPDSGVKSRLTSGLGLGAGLNQGEDDVLDNPPINKEDQVKEEVITEKEKEILTEDDKQVTDDGGTPDGLLNVKKEERRPEDELLKDAEKSKSDSRTDLFDSDDEDNGKKGSNFFGGSKDTEFKASVGSELVGLTAEEKPGRLETQDPTNLRPIVEDNS